MNETLPRRLELLGFIAAFRASKDYAPSLDEMAESLKVSRSRAVQLLAELVELGLAEQDDGKSRTVRPTPAGLKALKKAA